jgi:hypothetical protein
MKTSFLRKFQLLLCSSLTAISLCGFVEKANANVTPNGIRFARVCNNEKNYRIEYEATMNGNISWVSFKAKLATNRYVPTPAGWVYDWTSGYNWRQIGNDDARDSNGRYTFVTNIWNTNLTNEDVLVSMHLKMKNNSTIIDPGGIINLGSIKKGKCAKVNR